MSKGQVWVSFKRLVGKDGNLRNCPFCGGEVVRRCYGGCMPMWTDPVCKKCGKRFHLRRWLLFRKWFEVVTDEH